jgi:hypothetical protein
MKNRIRGTSLVELTIALGILAFALAAAASLVMATGRIVRNHQEVADSNDGARVAGQTVAKAIEIAGFGAPNGVWMSYAGTPVLMNSIFGVDGQGLNGTDELWVIYPNADAFQPTYALYGGGNPVRYGGVVAAPWSTPGSPLIVSDTTNFSTAGPLTHQVLVTNMSTAALITPFAVTASAPGVAGSILFTESGGTPVVASPEKVTGYANGDLVMEVRVHHYYVGLTPRGTTALYRGVARVQTDAIRNLPYTDMGAELVQDNIEDFQVAFGIEPTGSVGNPDAYVFQPGLAAGVTPTFTPGLRAVRISISALSKQPIRDEQNQIVYNPTPGGSQVGVPYPLENHTPTGVFLNQGYRRSLYKRQIETVNLATTLL